MEQIPALARDPRIALTVLAVDPMARHLAAQAPTATIKPIQRRPIVNRVLWEQTVLARAAGRFDLLYGIGNFASLLARRPQIVTFQNPNHFGQAARSVNRRLSSGRYRARLAVERRLAHVSLRRADGAIAISNALRAAMAEDVPGAEPHVILSAPPRIMCHDGNASVNIPKGVSGDSSLHRPNLPSRYALTVSNDYPHKDWDGIVQFFIAADDVPPLVIVGAPRSPRRHAELVKLTSTSRTPRVIFWGAEDDRARLDALYREADVFVAHSHLEAFPLTPYEALSRGVRVVASDIPSHREVCGARAAYYELADSGSLVRAVHEALRRPAIQSWKPVRTWEDNAREVVALMLAIASTARPPE